MHTSPVDTSRSVAVILLLAAVFAATLLPGSASAQTIPSPFDFIDTRQEVGVFAGPISPNRGSFGLGPRSGTLLGARYGIKLGGPFSIEGVATALPTKRDVINPRLVPEARRVGEADVLIATIEARLRFSLTGPRTWRGISPHFVFGGGTALDLKGTQDADRELEVDDRFEFGPSFLGSGGAGVRWFPGDGILVRADLGMKLWKLNMPSGFRILEAELGTSPGDEWVNSPFFTVGAAIRF